MTSKFIVLNRIQQYTNKQRILQVLDQLPF